MDWWSIAIIDFKITEDVFLDLTPYQFFKLLDRQKLKTIQEDYRSGILASLIHNFISKKPVNWLHWFSEHKDFLNRLKRKQDRRIDNKAIELNKMKIQAGIFGDLARRYARQQEKRGKNVKG